MAAARMLLLLLALTLESIVAGNEDLIYAGPCSEKQQKCWSKSEVLFSDGQCYQLLRRGPCGTSEWLVLDVEAQQHAKDGPVAVCRKQPQVSSSGCPRGWHFDAAGRVNCGVAPHSSVVSQYVYCATHHTTPGVKLDMPSSAPLVDTTTVIGIVEKVCVQNDEKLCARPVEVDVTGDLPELE